MTGFGGSLPPGCGALPAEQADALDLTPRVTLRSGIQGVFWDEDGNLIEAVTVTVPPDAYANLPEHEDTHYRTVGQCEWEDDLDLDANLAHAASVYQALAHEP